MACRAVWLLLLFSWFEVFQAESADLGTTTVCQSRAEDETSLLQVAKSVKGYKGTLKTDAEALLTMAGKNLMHEFDLRGHGRTSKEVLAVCASVIGALLVGWLMYYQAAQTGRDLKHIRLILLCMSFSVCSWGMNVVNKSLVNSLKAPTLVTAAQMFFAVLATLVMSRGKLAASAADMLKWSFIPFLFFGMLVTSFFTYEYLTLSMLMVVRNLGPLVTIPLESIVMPPEKRPRVTYEMMAALVVVLAGTLVYCQKVETSLTGMLFAVANMVIAIMDRLAQRRLLTTECKSLSNEMCVLLNNLIGIFPTMALGAVLGELAEVDRVAWFGSVDTLLLLLSGVIGSGICYFAIAVQREITATSFMVLQNAVRVAVVAIGIVVFSDPLGWPWQLSGLVLSFGGAIWYGKSQIAPTPESKARDAGLTHNASLVEKAGPAKQGIR